MRVNGQRIKQLREAKGWTQEQLAAEAGAYMPPTRVGNEWATSGLTVRTIQYMENGDESHRRSTVLAVATALDTTEKELCVDDDVQVEVWEQTVIGEDGSKESIDEVHLMYLSDPVITGNIYRKEPTQGTEYEFLGRREHGMIYGHYWQTKGEGSSGVLLLRETRPHSSSFQGQYTKIARTVESFTTDTLMISHINLYWENQGWLKLQS